MTAARPSRAMRARGLSDALRFAVCGALLAALAPAVRAAVDDATSQAAAQGTPAPGAVPIDAANREFLAKEKASREAAAEREALDLARKLIRRAETLEGLDPKTWRTDFNKAARQAVHARKPLCVYFFRPISQCLNLAQTMQSPRFQDLLRGFVCIQINEWRLENKDLNESYHIAVVPQIVLVAPDGIELARFDDIALQDTRALEAALAQHGKPEIVVAEKSPETKPEDMPKSNRLVFHEATPGSPRAVFIPPLGGAEILDFVLGNPDSEQLAGVEVVGWGDPEEQGGAFCRNTDQTGVGDGTGGFAYLKIPINDPTGSYRVTFGVWGKSHDPATRYTTWMKNIRVRVGPGATDWRTYHFQRTDPLKTDRYNELDLDFPAGNLPLYEGALVIGLGDADQQIWVSQVRVRHFPAPAPAGR